MKIQIIILSLAMLFLSAATVSAQEIFDVVRNNTFADVRKLIEADRGLAAVKDENGRTPLHWAARGVHFEILKYLVEKGADVNALDANGTAPLHSAASRSHLEACRWLIEKGAAVDIKNNSGATPFYYAAMGGNRELLEYLLAHGAAKADLELRNSWGRTPLCAVARDGGDAETIKTLISLGADVNAADNSGLTPIMLAAWRPYKDAVDVLLDAGSELHVNTPRGEKLLSYAAEGLDRLFDAMVGKGASLAILNEDGGTLLHSAAGGGSLRIVTSLVDQGFEVNQKDTFGWVPLHIAAEQGHKEVVSLLLDRGAEINARNALGETPYNIAQDREDRQLTAFLESRGADTSAPKFPRITGKYLGRPLPGLKPELFAPGIVSHRYKPHSTVAVSPAGDEIFWNPMILSRGGGYSYGYIMTTRLENGIWTHPERAFFSEKDFHDDHPFFSADGKKLYFLSNRPSDSTGSLQNQRTWYVEKTKGGWSEAKLFESLPMPTIPASHFLTFSFDKKGDYYFIQGDDIYVSRLENGKYSVPENLGENINTSEIEGSPLISPEGDFLIFMRGSAMQSFVSFKTKDKTWTKAVSVHDQLSGDVRFWNCTMSGKVLMLGGSRWISAEVVRNLKSRAMDAEKQNLFRKSDQRLGDTRPFGAAVADVDGDGDQDVFLTNYIGPSKLWLNDGKGVFSESAQDFGNFEAHDVAMEDLNGDGFPDIFLLNHASSSRVFFNDGKGNFKDSGQNIGGKEEFPGMLVLGDVDIDGDLDAFISYYTLPNRLWLNDGKGIFTKTGTLFGGSDASAMALADVNGDRSLDLFLTLMDAPDEVWINDGRGNFANSGQKLGNAAGNESVDGGDVDGDGDADFVVGNKVDGIKIWLNEKNTGKFVEAGPYFDAGTTKVTLFDADGDGDLDLFAANQTTGNKLWLNDGRGRFASQGAVFGSGMVPGVACGRLDANESIDVVVGKIENTGGNEIYFNNMK